MNKIRGKKLTSFLIIVVCISICFSTFKYVENVKADLSDGLEAHWEFNEGTSNIATDSSGNGNDGTIYGATYIADTPSGTGYSLRFSGNTNYVTTNLYQLLGPQTITLWIKFDENDGGSILSTHTKDDNKGNFVIQGGSSEYGIRVLAIDGWTTNLHAGSPYGYNDNTWHLVVLTHDGAGNYELFVDGFSRDTYSGSPLTDSTPYTIGRLEANSAYPHWLNGALDDVRIYNRVLTDEEIQELYPGDQLIADAGGPYSGVTDKSINFLGSAFGGNPPYVDYSWEFGDGESGSGQSTSHTYKNAGDYTVTLTVTDSAGNKASDNENVDIDCGICDINIEYPLLYHINVWGQNISPPGELKNVLIAFHLGIFLGKDFDITVNVTDGTPDKVVVDLISLSGMNDRSTTLTSPPFSTSFDVDFDLYKVSVTAYINGLECDHEELEWIVYVPWFL